MLLRGSLCQSKRGLCTTSTAGHNKVPVGTNEVLKSAAAWLKEADAVIIAAGAGIGIDSGLPDFRGNEGFWKAYPPLKKLRVGFVDMANPSWFRNAPEVAWGFYGHRLNLYRNTIPHAGFEVLRKIAQDKQDKKLGYWVFTSNVDGQFQKAGFPEERIVECHGSIHYVQEDGAIIPADKIQVEVDPETLKAKNIPKDKQGFVIRPNILMFSDAGWNSDRTDMQHEAMEDYLNMLLYKYPTSKVAVIEVGAGFAVRTVRNFTERILYKKGNGLSKLIRINMREPEVAPGHFPVPLSAKEALESLWNFYRSSES